MTMPKSSQIKNSLQAEKPRPLKWLGLFFLAFVMGFGSCSAAFGACFESSCGPGYSLLGIFAIIALITSFGFFVNFLAAFIRKIVFLFSKKR